jgi:hypothetical protein
LKATKAKLIVLGANMQSAAASKAFEEIDAAASLVVLDAGFAARDPGEAATKLLEITRSRTVGSAA